MFKFLRLFVGYMQPYVGTALTINYITMHSELAGPNVIAGGKPYSHLDSATLANAFIDNASNAVLPEFVSSTGRPEGNIGIGHASIGYEFAAPINIVAIKLRTNTTLNLGDIFVQGSNDGVNWTTKAFYRSLNFTANTLTEISIPDVYVDDRKGAMYKYIQRIPPYYFPALTSQAKFRYFRKCQHYGDFRISGTTTIEGNRVARQVYLMKTLTGEIVEAQWSNKDGEFNFKGIKMDNYTVLGVDRSTEQNSIVFSHLDPVE